MEATQDSIPEFISAVDEYGQTALHWAAGRGNLKASECLCKEMKSEGINIQMTVRQQTALHFAVQGGYTDIVRLLISSGADIDLKDVNGWTALDWARNHPTESKEAIIKLLESQTGGSSAEATV